MPAVWGTNQSDGTLAVGGLVVEGHLLIGQDVLVLCGTKKGFITVDENERKGTLQTLFPTVVGGFMVTGDYR